MTVTKSSFISLIFWILFLATFQCAQAQIISTTIRPGGSLIFLKAGDIKYLKKEKAFKIIFDYSDLIVDNDSTEEEFINEKVKYLNERKAGRGDKWKIDWFDERKEKYEPAFVKQLNKAISKIGFLAKQGDIDSRLTLIVRIISIDFSYNYVYTKTPAYVNFEYNFIETVTSFPLVSFYQNNVGSKHMGNFNSSSIIAESFARGGKILGMRIVKGLEKQK